MTPVWRPDAPRPNVNVPEPRRGPPHYAVVDTTFSTVDMGGVAVDTLRGLGVEPARIHRVTVPGFKDLAVACKRLIEQGCAIAVACGMPGPEPIDKQCGHEASLAIGQAQLLTSTHILEVFVHMDEAKTDAELIAVCKNRVAEHAVNAYWLVEKPGELVARAGTGQRQGFADVGPADPQGKKGTNHLRSGAAKAPKKASKKR
ncbi:MAG: riboflavin synthase [Candidatus Thermoplasmatota archaeon]